jgi:hypothetical protein
VVKKTKVKENKEWRGIQEKDRNECKRKMEMK